MSWDALGCDKKGWGRNKLPDALSGNLLKREQIFITCTAAYYRSTCNMTRASGRYFGILDKWFIGSKIRLWKFPPLRSSSDAGIEGQGTDAGLLVGKKSLRDRMLLGIKVSRSPWGLSFEIPCTRMQTDNRLQLPNRAETISVLLKRLTPVIFNSKIVCHELMTIFISCKLHSADRISFKG